MSLEDSQLICNPAKRFAKVPDTCSSMLDLCLHARTIPEGSLIFNEGARRALQVKAHPVLDASVWG